MIFYGTNGKHFATQPLPPPASCPACQRAGQLQASLVSRYAHVYWVPLFPYQKVAVLQCGACHWEATAPPAELASAVRELKAQVPHPAWTWAGLGGAGLLLAGNFLLGIRNHHQDEALLKLPRAGDVYTVRADSANSALYSLLKVRRVSGNSVELLANNYQTPDSSPFPDLNQDSSYSAEPFVLTRLDLQIMRRKGELTDVDRP